MTRINDISDLVRILKEHPDWVDVIRGILLSKELLNLPVQFAELTQQVAENSRQIAVLSQQLAQQVGENSRQIAVLSQQLAQQIAGNSRQIAELSQQVAENSRQVGENSRQFAELSSRFEEHSRQFAEFVNLTQSNYQLTIRRFEENYQRLNLIEGRLGNLEGSDYERKVRYRVLSRARSRFGLDNPYLALTQSDPEAPQLSSALARAVNSGAISRDEADDLTDTDIIISDQNNRHIAAEVSLTAGNDDISRAKARAESLSNATGGAVTPLVVTAILNGPQHDLAIAEGVDTLILSYP